MDQNTILNLLEPELYFLIQKLFAASPLQETYKVLSKELQAQNILPIRLDWQGEKHQRTFDDLERLHPHIGAKHLLNICSRIGPILDREIPPCVKGVASLLGSGKQSLLRVADFHEIKQGLLYYASRKHGMPICDPFSIKITHNITNVLLGRELSGPTPRILTIPPTNYSHLQLQRQTLGHLSAVYCLLFDHTGTFIITGADDLLIKLWSANSGRLIASFRGASAEITDIDINLENTLLAAGSIDRILRVWDLQTGAPIAILTCHTGMITSVHFCPSATWDVRYIATTSSDGSVAFWTYSHDQRNRPQFVSKPILYQEKMRPGQAQMICSSFSPGGSFLAAGSADHHVRIYLMRADEGPIRILETEVHSDRVDSIVWAHRGLRLVSGSKDGTAFIWHFERQQWKSVKLCMSTKLPNTPKDEQQEDAKKLVVTMVAWDFSDNFIVTAVSDHCLKVWRSSTGALERILTGHTDGIYVLESHPKDPYVMLSTGHDGQLFIWDVLRGKHIAHFTNNLDNAQGQGAVFDAKWSPDGSMFAASDSHGHIMIYGFGQGHPKMKMLPKELFFHTDYRPLVRDADHLVLDEQTQVPPHLMPPPFLVDIDGNPYPPMLQRNVPGRENCTSEQLIPNIIIGTGGRQEVIQGISEQDAPRSDIDRMIAALAQRRYGEDANEGPATASNASPRSIRNGPRRTGDIEGVRHSTGEWQRDPNIVWSKNVIVQPLNRSELIRARDLVEITSAMEMAEYQKEIKKRPLMINTAQASTTNCLDKGRRKRRNGNNTAPTRRTRANAQLTRDEVDEQEAENENEDSNTTSNSDDSSAKEDLSLSESSSDSDESSGYSDWVADQGVNLEPPKRSKRKSAAHKRVLIDHGGGGGDDDDDAAVGTSAKSTSKVKRITPPKIKNGEIPEIYKANLDWLSETIPRKAPYYPQMGDEVVYFVQGHQMYVNAVKLKKVYNVNNRDLPWTKHNLKDYEFVKIVGIKYEMRPPRLCCLKLALLDEQHRLTENVFTIKYHDMADVLDFFVLKQTYETAISRLWNINDKFRCMIDDGWWIGSILNNTPFSDEHPDSLFLCFEIQWDNGETERMSPWDLEPISEDRVPERIGEAVPVLAEEIQMILYQPTVEEWPRGDREASCRRIIAGLDKVMTLAIAEPFLAPVDLNLYPTYPCIVEYPIDISTIKARFENHFYRRITSAQFDVRYLATNAEKFNKPHSIIVKHARIITEVCLKIIKNCSEEIDVQAVYHQLMDTYESSCSDDDDADVDVHEPGPSSQVQQHNRSLRALKTRNLRSFSGDWRVEAKRLIDDVWRCEDSAPFRIPVDRLKHPEYYQIIDTPMDLSTVKEDLFGGNYETPLDFAKDMRLIFQNSKNFNTNKRSRIYAMTIRLSAMFEEQLKKVVFTWKRSKNKSVNRTSKRTSGGGGAKSRSPTNSHPHCNASDSDNSEKENQEEYPYKRTTRNHLARMNNKRNLPSTSKKPPPSDTSSDDEPILKNGRKLQDRRQMAEEEENEEEDDDDDEEFQPSLDGKKRSPLRENESASSSNESSEHSDVGIYNARTQRRGGTTATTDGSDESDYEPLSKYTRATSNHKRKGKITSSSDSDSGIKNNLRPRKMKKRCVSDSDSDNLPLIRPHRRYGGGGDDDDDDEDDDESGEDDDSDSDKKVVTVSSRGRVRKLTERARALLRK